MLALYDPETVRNGGQTSYSRLKTSVRLFYDQKMRSRNLKARNDMIHGGVVTRSRKENRANVERKVGDCWQWQATGQCSKGDSCGFHHGVRASGNGSELLKQKERTSSLAPNSKATKDGKENHLTKRMENLLTKGIKSHVNGEIVPKLQASSRVSELHFTNRMQIWQNMFFRHVELAEKPNKKSKKRGENGSVAS